jgi:preprotein translocase subunit YajC
MLNILFVFVVIGVVVYFQLNDYQREQDQQISNIQGL